MQEENISFEEIGKEETAQTEPSSPLFKQPIRGSYPNLYAELKARCAPENFMNPYEPDKVTRANELYSRVLSIDEKDDSSIKSLRQQAMDELGAKFSTEQLYNRLTDACNPKNFTGEAYNKDRLDLANQLYQSVLKNADNIIELEIIEVKAKELIEAHENKHPTPGGKPESYIGYLIFMGIISISIIIAVLFSLFY